MKPWLVVGFAAVVVAAILFASGSFRHDPASSLTTEDRPAQAAGDRPMEPGKAAFFKHCVACHSPDTDEYIAGISLKGYFNRPPTELADGTPFPRTDEAIRNLIDKGTTNMPPLSKGMTPQEIDDILAYLHAL